MLFNVNEDEYHNWRNTAIREAIHAAAGSIKSLTSNIYNNLHVPVMIKKILRFVAV